MIYIVEDDENIGQMECYALKNSGFGTELFEDSESFFSAVARRLPTLVILDLMLPGEDGLTILRRLRDSAETRKIPVIIVSAKSSEADAVRGLDSGADDYITKPFGVSELISNGRSTSPTASSNQVTNNTACLTFPTPYDCFVTVSFGRRHRHTFSISDKHHM